MWKLSRSVQEHYTSDIPLLLKQLVYGLVTSDSNYTLSNERVLYLRLFIPSI